MGEFPVRQKKRQSLRFSFGFGYACEAKLRLDRRSCAIKFLVMSKIKQHGFQKVDIELIKTSNYRHLWDITHSNYAKKKYFKKDS